MEKPVNRCNWAGSEQILIDYHDNEWGIPVHDDNKLFEILTLESMQAGLSWLTILKRRESFRAAFDGFDPRKVMLFDDKKVEELLKNEGIIRHRGKITAAINNAKAFVDIQKEYGSFDKFIWGYVDGTPIVNNPKDILDIQSASPLSDKISKDLRKMGFKFVGSTTIYAFLQAMGMVDDHLDGCGWNSKNRKKEL